MGRNVQDNVNSCISSMQNVISALESAESNCEKASNKKVISEAKDAVQCACQKLNSYCD